jgi:hypothetical protein
MADLFQDLYMITFKVIEIIVYLYCAITIYRKDKKYILNKTYFIALLGWVIYILFDAILFPIGHIETLSWGTVDGATVPLFANIFRDIAVAGGGVLAFGFLYASIIIRYGEATAKQRKTLALIFGGFFLFAIPTIIFDRIIKGLVDGVIKVRTEFSIASVITIFAQIIIYFIAIYQLFAIYRRINESQEKRRVLFFILGCLFIALGVLFFVIVSLVASGFAFITGPVGHAIWIIAPIFILFGIRKTS